MFDRDEIERLIRDHGAIARVVIAAHSGSSPREDGAAMLIWADGESGTIGGGALEHEAMASARGMLGRLAAPGGEDDRATGKPDQRLPAPVIRRVALGPALGQCCGGSVTLVTEIFTRANLPAPAPAPDAPLFIRPLTAGAGAGRAPLAIERLRRDLRAGAALPAKPLFLRDWLAEPMARPRQSLWIWGAGHVGRALIHCLAPLPDFALDWIDTAAGRFPATLPEGVRQRVAARPELLIDATSRPAWHLIVTFSHALDLEICHRLLACEADQVLLIGSASKAARFRARLRALGHQPDQLARLHCPIGDTTLGKHPQAIALGAAVQLLRLKQISETEIADDRHGKTGARPIAAAGGPD